MKKVSKYENKFAKLQKKAAEFNFRNQLKTVKKKEFTMDEEEAAAVSDKSITHFRDSNPKVKVHIIHFILLARPRLVVFLY